MPNFEIRESAVGESQEIPLIDVDGSNDRRCITPEPSIFCFPAWMRHLVSAEWSGSSAGVRIGFAERYSQADQATQVEILEGNPLELASALETNREPNLWQVRHQRFPGRVLGPDTTYDRRDATFWCFVRLTLVVPPELRHSGPLFVDVTERTIGQWLWGRADWRPAKNRNRLRQTLEQLLDIRLQIGRCRWRPVCLYGSRETHRMTIYRFVVSLPPIGDDGPSIPREKLEQAFQLGVQQRNPAIPSAYISAIFSAWQPPTNQLWWGWDRFDRVRVIAGDAVAEILDESDPKFAKLVYRCKNVLNELEGANLIEVTEDNGGARGRNRIHVRVVLP